MNLEDRVKKLETQRGKAPLDVKVLTDDELAVIITGNPGAKASDVTNEQLDEAATGFKGHIVRVMDQKTKDLTLRVIAGEVPGQEGI